MTPRQKNTQARNKKIAELFKKTKNKSEVGRKFGLSRERVRQILDKNYNLRRRKLSTGIEWVA